MKKILKLKLRSRSLFIKLMLSFMMIILLIASFHFFSFTFFVNNLRNGLIQYNNNNLENSTERFEKNFELVKSVLLALSFDDKVQKLNSPKIDYITANQLTREIQRILSANGLLYLDNIFLYFDKNELVLEKSRGADINTMFARYFYNPAYDAEAWKKITAGTSYNILSAVSFREKLPLGEDQYAMDDAFPVIVNNAIYPNVHLIGFVNAKKIYDAFHISIIDQFFIVDPDSHVLFSSNITNITDKLPLPLKGKEGYVKTKDSYYFYQQGSITGLTYVNVIPIKYLTSQITKLNITLITILVAAVFLSILVSVLFSMRFNNPVKKIIESIEQFNMKTELNSSIQEFDMIGKKIKFLLKKSHDAEQDLSQRNVLLKQYSFIHMLKSIHTAFDPKELFFNDKSYRFILYRFTFQSNIKTFDVENEIKRATYFIREYINYHFSKKVAESQTFQIEHDQILSVVFLDKEEDLKSILDHLFQVIDIDKDVYFLTVSVSDLFQSSSDFTKAYEQVLHWNSYRTFTDQTELVTGPFPARPPMYLLTKQDQEFDVNLRSGNAAQTIQSLRKLLSILNKNKEYAYEYYAFAEDILKKAEKAYYGEGGNSEGTIDWQEEHRKVTECHTPEQLELVLTALIEDVSQAIRLKKEKRDPITAFIFDYLEFHYADEITLESMADKLKITGGYLSTYFKEKTRKNFVDYVNEVRIHKAQTMLLDPSSAIRIQDVALQVGYQNIASFNRMFKRFTGLTPSEFRKTHLSFQQKK